jgi:hypothetical protein
MKQIVLNNSIPKHREVGGGHPSLHSPIESWLPQLRQTAQPYLAQARRRALLRLVWQESYLTGPGLIARVEDLLGRGCFGRAPRRTFYRDMAVLRRSLAEAGRRLVYCRGVERRGYWVEGRPPLDERLQGLIGGAVAEVDPRQMAVSRSLTPSQRFQQGRSMTSLAEQVAAYRLRRRRPRLAEDEARRMVREGKP